MDVLDFFPNAFPVANKRYVNCQLHGVKSGIRKRGTVCKSLPGIEIRKEMEAIKKCSPLCSSFRRYSGSTSSCACYMGTGPQTESRVLLSNLTYSRVAKREQIPLPWHHNHVNSLPGWVEAMPTVCNVGTRCPHLMFSQTESDIWTLEVFSVYFCPEVWPKWKKFNGKKKHNKLKQSHRHAIVLQHFLHFIKLSFLVSSHKQLHCPNISFSIFLSFLVVVTTMSMTTWDFLPPLSAGMIRLDRRVAVCLVRGRKKKFQHKLIFLMEE